MARIGFWAMGVTTKHYDMSLPWEGIRANAGYDKRQGSVWTARCEIEVPAHIQELFFPWIDDLEAAYFAGIASNYHLEDSEYEKSFSLQGFIELIKLFRTVLAQDAIELMDRFPYSPIWDLNIFKDPAFIEWREGMKECITEYEEDRVQQSVAALKEHV